MAENNSFRLSSSAPIEEFPGDLLSYLSSVDEAECHVTKVLSELNSHQSHWRPLGRNGWSVCECVNHIALTNEKYLEALELASKKAQFGHTPLEPGGFISRYFLKKTEPPVSLRIKAPASIRPKSQLDKQEVLEHYQSSNRTLRSFIRRTADLDLCGVRFKNPLVPGFNFTVATGLLIINAHTRRHLWQVDQLLSSPGFPNK